MIKNDVYKEVIHREDGIEMVEQVLNEIVQKAGDIVYKHHMQRRVVPYAVQRMKSDIVTIIDWMFITHDVGENIVQNEESIADHGDLSWSEDSEPLPCPIDTWAKSALTIIPASTNILPPDPSLDNSTEVLSIAPSNAANKRKLKAKTKSLEENASLNNSESPSPLTTSPSAMSLQRQKNPTQKTNTAYPQNTNTQKEDTQKSRISHVFASTQIKRQPTKNEIEQEQAEKFEKLRRELKGKEYSYDHNGNMVLLNNVDADKPNKEKVVPVKISIADDESTTQQEETENTKPTKSRSTSANKNGKPKKSDFVKETRPPQPSAFENIKLAPGVTLRDGNKIKEGAPISTLQQQNTPIPTFSNFGKNPPKMPPILPSLTNTPQQTQSPSPPILAWIDDSEKISLPNIKLNNSNNSSNNRIEPRSSTASSRG